MKVLLVDDERTVLRTLGDTLEEKGHDVTCLDNGRKAFDLTEQESFDCIISDIRMPGMHGMDLLQSVKEKNPGTEMILITAYATVEQAVEAMKKGAYDYITKPFMNEEVLLLLDKIVRLKNLEKENLRLKEELQGKYRFDQLIGKSKPMQKVFDLIRTIAKTDSSVLIIGESGTGKELVANAIHHNSPRKNKPHIKLSCAVFPEGLLEDELFGHVKGAFTDAKQLKKGRFDLADHGTIFLDDIDDMSLKTQVKLLRVLQEKEFEMLGSTKTIKVDIRVIAATKKDLKILVKEGTFREDLYYRLNVVPVVLPPLRKHKEDILLLAEHFLRKYGKENEYALSAPVIEYLLDHHWPGNIRELENAMERAIALSGQNREISLHHVAPEEPGESMEGSESASLTLKDIMEKHEKKHIIRVLKMNKAERNTTAQVLGINRKTLWEKMKHYHIDDITDK